MEEPNGLPPSRKFDHHIPLQYGTTPVNVRPYQYAHFKKKWDWTPSGGDANCWTYTTKHKSVLITNIAS